MAADLEISQRQHGGGPPIGLAMTPAGFDAAERDGVARIAPNLPAMLVIAQAVGFVADVRAMPPLLIVARDASPQRAMIGKWDTRLPRHQGDAVTGRFFPASELGSESAVSCNRDTLVRFAKQAGAAALTEITIWGWNEEHRREHAAAFAAGLLLAQCPLDLPPKPSVFAQMKGAVVDALTGDALERINMVKKRQPPFPEPFIITYRRPGLPAAPEHQPTSGPAPRLPGPDRLGLPDGGPVQIESGQLGIPASWIVDPAYEGVGAEHAKSNS